jgi:uncharacterized repeat protein (TIGR01451 family)
MRKLTYLVVFALFAVSLKIQAAPTVAGLILTNMSVVTAANSTFVLPSFAFMTNAVMFGGSVGLLSGPTVQQVNYPGRNAWFFAVTNLGNANADFVAKVVFTNYRLGGPMSSWGWALSNSSLSSLSPGASGIVALFITNKLPVSNNSYFSLLVKISNLSADAGSRAYYGIGSTLWYGGSLGILTNASQTNGLNGSTIGPVFYLPHASTREGNTNLSGFLTSVVSGPKLSIHKSIITVSHPSSGLGLAANTYAEPGSEVLYYIAVTNKGGSAAVGVKVVDTFNTSFTMTAYTNGTGYDLFSNALNGSTRVLTFTNNNMPAAPAAGSGVLIKIRLRIK